MGNKFIAGHDYNDKHKLWDSWHVTTKGRELLAAINSNNMEHIATGEPTYWPSDPQKIPDAIDFYITKGVNLKQFGIQTNLDLSSHIHQEFSQCWIIDQPRKQVSCNQNTNWKVIEESINALIDVNVPLKIPKYLEIALQNITSSIQTAAWDLKPPQRNGKNRSKPNNSKK